MQGYNEDLQVAPVKTQTDLDDYISISAEIEYRQDTGKFYSKRKRGNVSAGKELGSKVGKDKIYLRIHVNGKRYLSHRLAWLLTHKRWPTTEIDHINGDSLDNRITNLRELSQELNVQNIVKPYSSNSCGYLGVCYHKNSGKYRATVRLKGKSYHCGSFDDPETAHLAYLETKRKLHEGCTI